MFKQTRFLGSTVTSFTASIGWSETPSQLVVNLVDDPSIGDSFAPIFVGRPVTFVFGNFTFTGIIQRFSDNISTSGFVHEVTVIDPREILEGVPLILDGYTGSVLNLPGLLNVYGYLESFSFGNSQKNETGIPWRYVKNSVETLTRLPQQGVYGGPIYFLQSRYIVDLSLLPPVPEDYRIGGDSISLLQFISEVCEAGGCDYYVSMIETTPGIFVIQVNTTSRTGVINYGAVTQFLDSFSEYESKSIGRELANETSAKFLVGGKRRDMWYQPYDGSPNTIWQFWGFDLNGNLNIGTGYGDAHQVVLDSRSVNNPRVGPFYITNVAEIRSVLGGRANWETFLMLNKGNGGIHSSKVNSLGIIGYTPNITGQQLFQEIFDNYEENDGTVTLDLVKQFFPHGASNTSEYDQKDIETGYLYDFLYQIATEYYGKKFMVSIPYTYVVEEPDTGKIRLSQLPVESGFLEESAWPFAVQNNLLPIEVDKLSTEDGQIYGFVRFNNGQPLDLSDLNVDSVAFSSRNPQFGRNKLENYSVFVRCEIEQAVAFIDRENRFGPRAVITLDGVVHERIRDDEPAGHSLVAKFLKEGFESNGVDTTTQGYKTNVIDKLLGNIGRDILNYDNSSSAVTPDLAVVPLESQTACYGPWYAIGTYGKMEYEQDESLVPWNYAGYEALDISAYSKVSMAIGVNQQLEQGDITFPDAPFHNLGQAILAGGPLVSDISCSIGEGGAHTTYVFRRTIKQPRYGQAKAERVSQIARRQQQLRRNIRLAGSPKPKADLSRTKEAIKLVTKTTHPKDMKNSSHEVLVGQMYVPSSGNSTSSVFLQSDYNFVKHVATGYEDKAFISLDGLFSPYSTTSKAGYPSFISPTGSSIGPNVNNLNPFGSGHNIKVVGGDSSITDLFDDHSSYRPVGLRLPLVGTGWGYNTDGKPVPNKSGNGSSDQFADNYRTDTGKWVSGPIDLRWDASKGVWGAGGAGGGVIRATMIDGNSAKLLRGGDTVDVTNWLGSNIGAGDKVYLSLDENEYCIVNQMYYSVGSVVSSIGCYPDGTTKTCSTNFKIPSRISHSGPSGCPQD